MGSQQFPFEQELKSVAPPPKGTLEQIFYNDAGLRSGWRLLLFTAMFVTLEIFSEAVIRTFIRPAPAALTPAYLLLVEIARFIVLLLAAYLMSRIEMRRLGVYGLPLAVPFSRRFFQGCLAGLCEVAILMGLIAAFGGYSFGPLALRGAEIIQWFVLWAVIFVFVGFSEEFAFRGYAQFTLADGIGFWPAAIILSACFGIVHLENGGEKWFGILSIIFIGLVFALALRRTGSLWFVVGFHAAFDFGETFLFSVPNSGMRFTGHLSQATLNGPAWLTGGSTGPEGSVFSFLTMAGAAVAIHFAFPAKKPAGAASEGPGLSSAD